MAAREGPDLMHDFTVVGMPAPQGSKRHVGNGRMVEQGGDRVKFWREAVRATTIQHVTRPIEGPVLVILDFVFPRPKNHYRSNGALKDWAPEFHTQRPDVDKLIRSTLDGLTSAGVFDDDCRVAVVQGAKRYATAGGLPGARVRLGVLADGLAP